MAEQVIKEHQIISVKQLVRAVQEGKSNAERFCFIIGSGASVSSGIPTGAELEYQWMKELEETSGLEEIREVAKTLKEYLDNDFATIEADWEKVKEDRGAKESGIALSSAYYFDIYKLRFFPNHRNGYHYLEKIMANKNPGFGYHPLALMLTDGTGSNLVITTNFDSLVEDALFLYTDDKPLVINHELLAEYAGDANIKRPIIAKVHRGIFFDPLNQPEETNELKGKWSDVLGSVFQNYTPIVIGYGGDNSLMNLLESDNIKMKNGIYWCYYEKYGLPNSEIQKLIQKKNGYLVRTAGFDATMLAFGNALFPDKIGVHEAEEYLNKRISAQIANYEMEYKRLTELEHSADDVTVQKEASQSETDFKMEVEKMVERSMLSEKERREQKQMTAWDYRRQGDRYYDSGQYAKAVECYSAAIDMQPKTAQFYNDRGCAYNYLGEYDKAISDLDKAIELNPKFADAYNSRGCAYSYRGEYNKAISDLDRAIELNPKFAEAYSNRGCVYDNLREYNKAISDYNKAIELDPKLASAYNSRGYTYSGIGEYDKAISDFEKSIELDSKSEDSYKHYGVICKKRGDFDKALELLTKAIELDPKYKKAYEERAEVYRSLGKISEAEKDEAMAAEL